MATRQISIPVWYLPDGVTPTAVRIDFLLVDASSVPMSGIVGTEQILSRVHVLTADAIQLISLTTTDTISPENYYLCTIYGPDLEEQFTFQIADEPGTIEFVDLRGAGAPIDPADPIYSRLLPATADNVNDVVYWDGADWVAGPLPTAVDWTLDQDPSDIHEANITQLSVTQHESAITHDNLTGVTANEHIDWTQDQGGAAYVDPGNYVGGVTSFNARTGAVVPASGDYDADGITETASNKIMTAAERTKLAGIEAAATADQTGAEIKVAYEGEADTNAFTDAEQAKLAAIEAAATADLTGAEIKALYEAELDTNAFTDTEQTKLTGIEANATGDQTGAEIKALYEAEADTNAFTDAEQTKLTGIETAATADQTDAEIETAYNNEVAQISTAEIEAGTSTDDRRLTPAKLKEFTDYHSYPDVSGEPNGFVDIDDVVLGWTDGTRTMTIDPAVTSFSLWSNGTLFTKSAQESIQITDAEGGHYIYYDGTGVLQVSTSFDESYILQYALVAYVYWDATNDRAIPDLITELHGMSMSPATHMYLHNTQGTKYETGLLPTIDSTGDGDTDSHAQFSVTAGYVWDEDIRHLIASKVLTGNFYKLWKDGANGDWRMSTTADSGLVENTGTGRAAWNEFTGGSWQLAELTNNDYVLAHIVAIPGLTESWGVVIGQSDYSSIVDAEQGAATELNTLDLVGWPWTEACFVATVILKTSNTYTNTWKSRVEPVDSGDDFIDWRATGTGSGGSGGTTGPVEHNSTTGLQGGTTDEYYHLTSAEQTKLTGIETAATADQSDAEIETAYNNQVAIVSQAAAEAGTDTAAARWTAQRVAQAIAALGGSGGGVTAYVQLADPVATAVDGDFWIPTTS